MNIDILPLGIYQANCYIVSRGDRCITIDPGGEPGKVIALLQERSLKLEAIFLTHTHFDHVGGVEALVQQTGCTLWMHPADHTYGPEHRRFFPLSGCTLPGLHFFDEGDVLSPAGLTVTILSTPGHTRGSVCIAVENALFTGDTLFAGSCGRTDLEGGDSVRMQDSLHRLRALPADFTVYPGHGPATLLSREKEYNPYMR